MSDRTAPVVGHSIDFNTKSNFVRLLEHVGLHGKHQKSASCTSSRTVSEYWYITVYMEDTNGRTVIILIEKVK